MAYTPSRRTLVKGATWAAPVIAATATIPAYAASSELYGTDASSSGYYHYNGYTGSYCSNSLRLTNSNAEHGAPAGMSVYYEEGNGKTQSVTIKEVETVWYLPENWVESFTVSGSLSYYGSFAPMSDSFTLYDGTPVSTEGYTAYVFTLKNPITIKTQLEGSGTSFSSTYYTATPTYFNYCNTSDTLTGYVVNKITFTTESGYTATTEYANKVPFYDDESN